MQKFTMRELFPGRARPHQTARRFSVLTFMGRNPQQRPLSILLYIITILLITILGLLWSGALVTDRTRLHAATAPGTRHAVSTMRSATAVLDCKSPIRIMPLGNSITRGSGTPFFTGYRQPLYINLRGAGYDVDFVGSERNGGGTALPFDLDNEGHSGQAAEWIADRVITFLNENPADIVLLHVGTNDLQNGDAPETAVNDTESILDLIDSWEDDNDEVIVVLARIINRATVDPRTSEYNRLLAEMARARIDDGDRIVVVDMENSAGLQYQENGPDWSDSIHPSYHGYQKMAALWLDRMRSELDLPVCIPLQVSMTADRTLVDSGGNVKFTVSVSNRSDAAMTNLVAVDSPAASCNRGLGDLPPGASTSYECTVNNFTRDTILFIDIEGESADSGEVENTAMVHVAVQAQNSAPVVDLNGPVTAGSNRTVRFTEDKAPVKVAHPDAFLTDPNGNTQVDGASLSIANPLDGNLERLAADVAGTGIEATYRAASATLELNNRDTIENYQKVLRTVTYENRSQNPHTAARRIQVSIADVEVAAQNISVTSVPISPVNDAPTLDGTLRLEVLRRNEQSVTPTVLQATDVDNAPTDLIYTVQTLPQHGTLRLNGTELGVGDSFTQLDIDRSRVRYEHSTEDGHQNATEDAFSFVVADGTGGKIDNASLPIFIVDEEETYLPFAPRN